MGALGGMVGGLLGGGGLGGIPIIGGMFGTGSGGNTPPSMPTPSMTSPGYGPGAFPGWPVPQMPLAQTPKQNFTGDLSKAGYGESNYGQHQGQWAQPGALSSYWGQNQGKFNEKGPADQYWAGLAGKWNAPNTSQNTQTAWDQFNKSVPANTDPYYDNAIRLATRDINRQSAAQGIYGGGTGLAPVNEAVTNLRAQQAKDNAQYGLSRAGLGGQLAQASDAASLGAQQGQLGWLTGMGNLGLGVQNADLGRILAGGQLAGQTQQGQLAGLNAEQAAALAAQQELSGRAQGFFENNLNMGQALSGPLQNIYMQSLAAQMGLTQQQMQMLLGYGSTAANQSANNQAESEQGIMNFASLIPGMGGKK